MATTNSAKIQKAKQDLITAKARLSDLIKTERDRVGKLFEEVDFLEADDHEIIAAISYYKNAPVEERLRILNLVKSEVPNRFRKSITAQIQEHNQAKKASATPSDQAGKAENEAGAAE